MDERTLTVLVRKLKRGSEHEKISVLSLICDSGDKRVVPELLAALKREQNTAVCLRIICTLGRLGDSRAEPSLMEMLSSPDWRIKAQCAQALGELKAVQAVDRLVTFLGDQNDLLHWSVCDALGSIGGEKALGHLLDTLERVRNNRRCWHIIYALGKIGDEKAFDRIIPFLSHPDSVVRRHAVLALRQMDWRRARNYLKKCLKDVDGDVRHYADEALRGQVSTFDI